MTPASTRLLAASLAAVVALGPTTATASPYHILAQPTAPACGSASGSASGSAPVSSDSSVAQPQTAAPTDSAAIAAATSPTEPLSDDPALEYRRGEQAYALGNYEQAVRHFERSYQL